MALSRRGPCETKRAERAVLATTAGRLPVLPVRCGSRLHLGLRLLTGERNLCPQLRLEELRRFPADATESRGYRQGQEHRDQEENAKSYANPSPATHACVPFGVELTYPPFRLGPQTPSSALIIISGRKL